jgi:hypothetical protein
MDTSAASDAVTPAVSAVAAEVTVELAAVLARLGELTDAVASDSTTDDVAAYAARIDQVALLERIQAAAAATQAALMVGFARSQVEAQQRALLADPRKVGRGITDQLTLACRVSPSEGSRRFGVARALHFELPATAGLLRDGGISAYVAGLVTSETRHLDPDRRRAVDGRLAGELADCAPRKAAMLARKYAYETDPEGYVRRGRTARADRRVGLRPAPDTMAILSGFLPVEQGVACLAALRAHTDSVKNTGDARSRDQIMADTLVERVTGQAAATDVQAEVAIVVPVDALVDPGTGQTAELLGHGPIPNGRAVCVRSNQVREMPGWAVRLVHNGLGDHPHTVVTVTPTGHTYTSRAGPAP